MFNPRQCLVSVVLCLLIACWSIHCNVLDEQNQNLDSLANELKNNFETAKSLFWQAKQRADEIDDRARADDYLNLGAHGTYGEIVKYAILHKSILAGKYLVNTRFVVDGDTVSDSQGQIFLASKLVPALVSRLVMRGYADAVRYTEQLMIKFYILVKLLVEQKEDADAAKATVKIYKLVESFEAALQSRLAEYQASLKKTLADLVFDDSQAKFIVAILDRTIDQAMDCDSCSSGRPDEKYFSTESMFKNEESVFSAIAEVADEKLEEVVAVHKDFDIHSYGEVKREDIIRQMNKILEQYKHLL